MQKLVRGMVPVRVKKIGMPAYIGFARGGEVSIQHVITTSTMRCTLGTLYKIGFVVKKSKCLKISTIKSCRNKYTKNMLLKNANFLQDIWKVCIFAVV